MSGPSQSASFQGGPLKGARITDSALRWSTLNRPSSIVFLIGYLPRLSSIETNRPFSWSFLPSYLEVNGKNCPQRSASFCAASRAAPGSK